MATRAELKKLEKQIVSGELTKKTNEILKKLRGLYLYYNEPNKNDKSLKIHTHFCGECCWGAGKQPKSTPGKNGTWIGPFNEINQAKGFAQNHFPQLEIGQCTCLKHI